MWKRDEAVRPANTREAVQPGPAVAPAPGGVAAAPRPIDKDLVNIGKSVLIKGELSGSEDLTIEGYVEGTIELRENVLTIGPNGRIKAHVFAKSVIVLGELRGNLEATDKVDIRDKGSVEGDIIAPRVAIAEGAMFRGSVDMQRAAKGAANRPSAPAEGKSEPKAVAAAPLPAVPASPSVGARS